MAQGFRSLFGRRAVLAAALLAPWLGGLLRPGAAAAGLRGSHAEAVAALFRHRRSAAAIGRRYLAAVPTEADLDRLLAGLGEAGAGGQSDLAQRLRARISQDFARGDTVQLEGWVLARSECRACAVVSMIEAGVG